LISSAGYIVNDINDLEGDKINKPNKVLALGTISIENAKIYYRVLNTLGIALGVILGFSLKNPSLSLLFVSTSIVLYFYSIKLKQLFLVGSLVIAALIAFTVLFLLFFINNFNSYGSFELIGLKILVALAFFSFLINLLREIVKDIEDINGDYKLNRKTLPIVLGISRTKTIIKYIGLFTLIALLLIVFFFKIYTIIIIYLIFFVLLPLAYFVFKLNKARTQKHFSNLSVLLKVVQLFGVLIIVVIAVFYKI
jgi:4-hydroxybenzoate polyprenyltransferase